MVGVAYHLSDGTTESGGLHLFDGSDPAGPRQQVVNPFRDREPRSFVGVQVAEPPRSVHADRVALPQHVPAQLGAEQEAPAADVVVERDSHGHLRLAEVDLGNILKAKVQERLQQLLKESGKRPLGEGRGSAGGLGRLAVERDPGKVVLSVARK